MSKTLSQVILESWIKGRYENELKELQSEFIKAIDNEIESLEKRIVRKLEFDHKKEEIDELVSKIKELKELRRNVEYDLLTVAEVDIWGVYSKDLTDAYNKFREQLKNENTVEEFKGGFISGGLHNTGNLIKLDKNEVLLNKDNAEELLKNLDVTKQTLSNIPHTPNKTNEKIKHWADETANNKEDELTDLLYLLMKKTGLTFNEVGEIASNELTPIINLTVNVDGLDKFKEDTQSIASTMAEAIKKLGKTKGGC